MALLTGLPRLRAVGLAFLGLATLATGCGPSTTHASAVVVVNDYQGHPVAIFHNRRVIGLGTGVVEAIYALGAGPRLLAVDASTKEYIPQTASLPSLGPARPLPIEGIVSLNPDLMIATVGDSASFEPVARLDQAGVASLVLNRAFSEEQGIANVRAIAAALGLAAEGERVVRDMERELGSLATLVSQYSERPKVLFIGKGNTLAATTQGTKTTVDEIIRLSGGRNAVTSFEGTRPLTDEAIVAANPDVILMTEKGFARIGGIDGVLKLPGIAATTAGQNRRIVWVPDMNLMTGYSPGIGRAVRAVVDQVYGVDR